MMTPTSAPPSIPDRVTVRARYPSQETIPFTANAHGAARTSTGMDAESAAFEHNVPTHRIDAATAGTEILSSRRTGMVSTKAAHTAATIGAMTTNAVGGGDAIAGLVHQASATPAAPPNTMKAAVPAAVLSRFQLNFHDRARRPTSVAAPSPSARIPHAAAATSSRFGKIRIRNRTASGYRRMPSGKPRASSTGR